MQSRFTFLLLIVAVVASVFAIWPAVADAPWEDDTVIQRPTPAPRFCDQLEDDLREAKTEVAAQTIHERGRQHCNWPRLPRSESQPIQPIRPLQPLQPIAPIQPIQPIRPIQPSIAEQQELNDLLCRSLDLSDLTEYLLCP